MPQSRRCALADSTSGPESYFEMLKSCTDGGKLQMKVIKGLIPSAYAVIEKPKEGSV